MTDTREQIRSMLPGHLRPLLDKFKHEVRVEMAEEIIRKWPMFGPTLVNESDGTVWQAGHLGGHFRD